MKTIAMQTCQHDFPTTDYYDLLWQLIPEITTFKMPPYKEPHYYSVSVSGDKKDYANMLKACGEKRVLLWENPKCPVGCVRRDGLVSGADTRNFPPEMRL
eukprot:PhM_4_TR13890/c3_g3_i3/m.5533